MQGSSIPQQPGKPALRSGALLGVALGIIHSAIVIITSQVNNGFGNTSLPTIFLYLVTPLIWIVGLLAAGAAASRITGKISTGTLAGLFAGTFGGIIAGFGQAIATVLAENQQSTVSPESTGLLLVSGFTIMFFVMVLALGAGAGFGALGGLIGQSMSNVRPQPAQPAQPAYPPAVIPYYMPQPVPATPQPQQVPLPQQPEIPAFPEQ